MSHARVNRVQRLCRWHLSRWIAHDCGASWQDRLICRIGAPNWMIRLADMGPRDD